MGLKVHTNSKTKEGGGREMEGGGNAVLFCSNYNKRRIVLHLGLKYTKYFDCMALSNLASVCF